MTTATPSLPQKPAHVPDELFWGHNYEEFAHEGDNRFLASDQALQDRLPPILDRV